jgi:hypothetical protein
VPGGNVRGLWRWMALRRWQPRAGWREVSAFVGVAREKARLLSAAGSVVRRATATGDSTRAACLKRSGAGLPGYSRPGVRRGCARIFSEGPETVPELVRVMPRC